MKRTTTRRRRQARAFMADNRRLFPFAGLFLLGTLIGVLLFMAARDGVDWAALLQPPQIADGWRGMLAALWDTVFSAVFLLAGLFLLGLWPCGAPFALAVPLFYGLGLGLTEAYFYSLGGRGVLQAALLVMPRGLLTAVVLAMACVESLRLSALLARQLLPSTAGGGVAPAFRLYCLRFLLFFLAAVFVGLADVLLRVVCGRFLW